MEDFVIISYNSNNFCNQSGNDSLGRIVDLVRVVRPHVVCLQVCDQGLVLKMAAIKPYNYNFSGVPPVWNQFPQFPRAA